MQFDQNLKGRELLQMRNEHKEIRNTVLIKEQQIEKLNTTIHNKDREISDLIGQLNKLKFYLNEANSVSSGSKIESNDLTELKQKLKDGMEDKIAEDSSQNGDSDEECKKELEIINSRNKIETDQHKCLKYEMLRRELEDVKKKFETERFIWTQEKENVLRYQKQLQFNYVQMFRRNRALEEEFNFLVSDTESNGTLKRENKIMK